MGLFTRRSALMLLAGFGLLALGVSLYVLGNAESPIRLPTLIGVGFPLLFVLIVVGYVWRYHDHREAPTLLGAAASGTAGLAGVFALTGASFVWGQRTQGVQITAPETLIIETGLGGALVGLLVGHLHGRNLVQRQELKVREQRLQVLARVLRHDLRNKLNIALGQIEFARGDAPAHMDAALSKAMTALNDLLTTAELARDTRTSGITEPIEQDLVAVTEQLVSRTRDDHPNRDIRLSTPDGSIPVTALESLGAGLRELVRNACDHGDGPVEIAVVRTDDSGVIRITDHGGGITEADIQVIESGEETPLHHGSGLGLWMVHWVANGSNGELGFERDETTTVEIVLPTA